MSIFLEHMLSGILNQVTGSLTNESRRWRQNKLLDQQLELNPQKLALGQYGAHTGRLNAITQYGNLGLNQEKFGYQQEQGPIKLQEARNKDVGGYLNTLGDTTGATQARLGTVNPLTILPGAQGRAVQSAAQKSGAKSGAAASAKLGVLRTQRMREAEGAAASEGRPFDTQVYGQNLIPPKPSNSKDTIQERLTKTQITAISKMIHAQYLDALKNGTPEDAQKVMMNMSRLQDLAKHGNGPLHPEDIQAIFAAPLEHPSEGTATE